MTTADKIAALPKMPEPFQGIASNEWAFAATLRMCRHVEQERDALRARNELLVEVAQAVVDRWDTPLWKDVPATAEFINDLRAVLQACKVQP
jgi:hypothetical protein